MGSTITDLVLEVLAPVDPKVSLGGASTVEVIDHLSHPNGRLYLAISDGAEDRILVLDEGVDPHIIEVRRPMDGARIHDLHLDATNQELLIAADEGRLVALSLEDHLTERSLPSVVGPGPGAWDPVGPVAVATLCGPPTGTSIKIDEEDPALFRIATRARAVCRTRAVCRGRVA